MSQLINAAVNVKTPLTLLALLGLFLLIAFRTQKVPQLFFKLAENKLTRERYAQLLHRFMTFGFLAFLVVCGSAVASQLLAFYSRPRIESVEAFKSEVDRLHANNDAAAKALADYQNALSLIDQKRLTDAISSLESSIKNVPTVSAHLTAAYLYAQLGQTDLANSSAGSAESLARQRGDALQELKAKRFTADKASVLTEQPDENGNRDGESLIGPSHPLLAGGNDREHATPLPPGRYLGQISTDLNTWNYYLVKVNKGQTITVKFRSPDASPCFIDARIHNSDGGVAASASSYGLCAATPTMSWTATDTVIRISVSGAVRGTVFGLSVH